MSGRRETEEKCQGSCRPRQQDPILTTRLSIHQLLSTNFTSGCGRKRARASARCQSSFRLFTRKRLQTSKINRRVLIQAKKRRKLVRHMNGFCSHTNVVWNDSVCKWHSITPRKIVFHHSLEAPRSIQDGFHTLMVCAVGYAVVKPHPGWPMAPLSR